MPGESTHSTVFGEDSPQVSALRAYVERREHADHDTFAFGRAFAEALLETIDTLAEQNYRLWNAGQRVCNERPGAVAELGDVLDSCRPLDSGESEGT